MATRAATKTDYCSPNDHTCSYQKIGPTRYLIPVSFFLHFLYPKEKSVKVQDTYVTKFVKLWLIKKENNISVFNGYT